MKKNFFLVLILSSLLNFTSCKKGTFCENGHGDLSTEERLVSEFDRINLLSAADVYIIQDQTQALSAIAQDNILKILETQVVDRELLIDFSECVRDHKQVTLHATMSEIRYITLKGSGNIISEDYLTDDEINLLIPGSGKIELKNIDFERIVTEIAGSGDIALTGKNIKHNIIILGSGNVLAFDLESETVNIQLFGSGNIYVSASVDLNVKITGSGNVYYKGSPNITQEITGSGKVVDSN